MKFYAARQPKIAKIVLSTPSATAFHAHAWHSYNETYFQDIAPEGRGQTITKTSEISDIKLVAGDDDDDAIILIKYTASADQRLHDVTTNHSGMHLAFLFNDEVLLNIIWQGPYGMDTGGGQLSIRHGMKRAQRLMKAIQGCTAANASEPTP